MNREKLEEWLKDISTPTGLSYSGDRTLSNSEVDTILEYVDNLQFKIDKAIEYIEKNILDNKIEKVDWDYDECYYSDMPADRIKPLIDILKEVENVENN